MRSRSALFFALLHACAPQVAPSQHGATEPKPARSEAPRPRPSRDLRKDATFAELVTGISLEELRETKTRRCLLGRTKTGYRVDADFAISVHPVAAPPPDLDAAVQDSETARLLSRWGRYGVRPSQLTLAALTDTPPSRAAWAVVVTDRGLYLRPSDEPQSTMEQGPVDDAGLREQLLRASAQHPDLTLFVSAERDIPVRRLAHVLQQLAAQHSGPITLAVALSPETALPAPRSSTAAARRCPDGLPESEAVEGDLPVSTLTQGLEPLRARAASCLAYADARGAAGGRMLLGLRVAADGGVSHACMIADEAEDDALAACLLAAAQDLRFPAPDPIGTVDVELPLLLRPNSPPAQAAVCEPTQ